MQTKEERLQAIVDDIKRSLVCPLKDAATNLVFGKGNPNAPILFIGEAPGEKEDLQGIPFVGSAGKQLDKMLQSIGLTLDECYVANILKYRPPNNREPQPDEMARHTPYLVRQIDVITPKVIVTLGNFSTKFVLGGFSVEKMQSVAGVGSIHGKIHKQMIDGRECTIVPLYHPAACLYNPNLRETMMQDFQIIKQFLDKTATRTKEATPTTAPKTSDTTSASTTPSAPSVVAKPASPPITASKQSPPVAGVFVSSKQSQTQANSNTASDSRKNDDDKEISKTDESTIAQRSTQPKGKPGSGVKEASQHGLSNFF